MHLIHNPLQLASLTDRDVFGICPSCCTDQSYFSFLLLTLISLYGCFHVFTHYLTEGHLDLGYFQCWEVINRPAISINEKALAR